MILETTGLADPAPILSTLLHDPQLKHHFSQGTLVTLVDAEHARLQSAHQPEWLAQVSAADKLLLSKCDRIDHDGLLALQTWLAGLNPLAELDDTQHALAEPGQLFALRLAKGTHAQRFRWLGAVRDARYNLTPGQKNASSPFDPDLRDHAGRRTELARVCYLAVNAVT